MIVILSDIHSNLAALEAVLEHCAKLPVKAFWCLGDVIGYGPDPVEVSRLAIERFTVSLCGNHEEALVTGKHRFNPYALQAIDWNRERIKENSHSRLFSRGAGKDDLFGWFKGRKPFVLQERVLMVHGSIYDPVHDYVDEPENPVEAEQMIDTLDRDFTGFDICFAGHNHTPFLATRVGTIIPHDAHNRFRVPKGHKAYICVGSVGQPRDRDPRASFAIMDGDEISFHRIPYDLTRTVERIRKAGLHEFLAQRLIDGI